MTVDHSIIYRIEHSRKHAYWSSLTANPQDGYWSSDESSVLEFDDYDDAEEQADRVDGYVIEVNRYSHNGVSSRSLLAGFGGTK